MQTQELDKGNLLTQQINLLTKHRYHIDECIKQEKDGGTNKSYRFAFNTNPIKDELNKLNKVNGSSTNTDHGKSLVCSTGPATEYVTVNLIPELIDIPEVLTIYRHRLTVMINKLEKEFLDL